MTKRKQYTILEPAQKVLIAQVLVAFPNAKYSDIAKVAGVSNGTISNIRNLILGRL